MMDFLSQPLKLVAAKLQDFNIPYTVRITRPTRNYFKLEDDSLYVIRQQQDADGIYHFTAAAKMGKEVL